MDATASGLLTQLQGGLNQTEVSRPIQASLRSTSSSPLQKPVKPEEIQPAASARVSSVEVTQNAARRVALDVSVEIDPRTNLPVYRIFSQETGQMIAQFPNSASLYFAARFDQILGERFNQIV